MVKLAKEETFYEILGVGQHASVSEITAAYYAAKNAFSKDSLATYSLLPEENTAEILTQLETAYLTLTNPDKRRDYDRRLASPETFKPEEPMTPIESHKQTENNPQPPLIPETSVLSPALESHPIPSTPLPGSDLNLLQIRESKGLTLHDVSRITKIPTRYLKALEEHKTEELPAKVYVQGFLKNLAQLYRLDAKVTVAAYFDQDSKTQGPTGH